MFFKKMAKNHFVSHFLPFQINTTIFIFVKFLYKMAAAGHFGCPKITFGRISGHFGSISNFFFLEIFDKWLTSAILGVRNSLSIAFQVISDRYATFNFFGNFWQMAAVGHFGCPKFTLDHIFWPFEILCGMPRHKCKFTLNIHPQCFL